MTRQPAPSPPRRIPTILSVRYFAIAAFVLAVAAAVIDPMGTQTALRSAPTGHDHASHDHGSKNGMTYQGLEPAADGPCAGAFEVEVAGDTLCTHGPDEPMDGLDPSTPRSLEAMAEVRAPRSLPCIGDGKSGRRVKVLYVHFGNDRFAQVRPTLMRLTRGVEKIYNASAKATGGERHVRFVTVKNGDVCQPDISSVQLSGSARDDFGATMNQLAQKGFDRKRRKYVLWVDADVYCGIGTFADDDSKGRDNRSNFGPFYGRNDTGCWSAMVASHELGHNLGAVSSSAPNSSGAGHCVDEYDVMCYADGGPGGPLKFLCGEAHDNRLDCNHDDYYSTDPPAGSYLATHFNVADNLFLLRGSPQPALE